MVDTQMGELMAATLKDNGVVWVLDHLKKRVVENKISPPFFIRPQGMKMYKNNPNRYYAYDLVVASNKEEISEGLFDLLLLEQTRQYKKWGDLENKKTYLVTDATVVNTIKGDSMILTLKNGAVWAPEHLKKKIIERNICPPFYIRPQGLKPCKNNTANRYYSYDLVVKKTSY